MRHALVDAGPVLGLLLQLLQLVALLHDLDLLLQQQDLLVGLARLLDQLGLREVHVGDVLSNHSARHQGADVLRAVAVASAAADRAHHP